LARHRLPGIAIDPLLDARVDAYIWRLRKDRNFGTVTEGVPETLVGATA
jgi:hypothetical protein